MRKMSPKIYQKMGQDGKRQGQSPAQKGGLNQDVSKVAFMFLQSRCKPFPNGSLIPSAPFLNLTLSLSRCFGV